MRARLACLLLLVGCTAPATRHAFRPGDAVSAEAVAHWDRIEPSAFAELALATFPDAGAPRELEAPLLAELSSALDGFDARAMRAAVLLGRSRSAAALEQLIARLELRAVGPDVGSDAADVTAAQALARLDLAQRPALLERLLALAVGPLAHPDLEVRTECARACVLHGRDEPIPFLLLVLRIDTWIGATDARDFQVSQQTAWARHRAAEALATRARVAKTYHPDGSVERRQVEALKLEEALRAAGALR
ncbi:MAG: hypothetical protein EPO68_08765 [Planctomycetota bacterium]|nr:MAG: hypothetical protein EPO68_08765 [Planctomycetota bacterium]